jgi:hypothetical protein
MPPLCDRPEIAATIRSPLAFHAIAERGRSLLSRPLQAA